MLKFVSTLALCSIVSVVSAQTSAPSTRPASTYPTIAGNPIDPKTYQGYVDEGFLPLRGEMTDVELAQKFDLDLPQMAEVKAALAKGDAKALERSLADYLNSKLPPVRIKPTGKLTSEQKEAADRWLRSEMAYHGRTYKLGADANFWNSVEPDPLDANSDVGLGGWRWNGELCVAYQATGESRYAEGILTYARAFYRNARPAAKAPDGWTIKYFRGPWHDNWVSTRLQQFCMWKAYQYVGNYAGTTDADRVMFLKMLWEHADWCYHLMAVHRNDTFESAHVGRAFFNVPTTLPEFKDTKTWLERIRTRYMENVRDCVLDDGGSAIQRTGYNFGTSVPYMEMYRLFKANNLPVDETFRRGLERVGDFSLFVLSPTFEYSMFGSGSLGPLKGVIDNAAELFPERSDFVYASSEGKAGAPNPRVAKAMWHEGWLSMRGDWTSKAPFLVMNYNGSPKETQSYVTSANLNSFGLWANGWPYMTDPGATDGYGEREFWDWCMHTRSNNTVLVDEERQDHVTGGGRLENWASLPESGLGVTYSATVSTAYRKFGVTHRRAVLFVRPDYFLIFDVMSGDGVKPHKYNWQGHFQPAQVTVDATSKAVRAAPKAFPPLYVIPARPESFVLEQKSGPIDTRELGDSKFPYDPNRQITPYISLEKSGVVEPFAFGVLLYPVKSIEDSAPTMSSLAVADSRDASAMGFRVRHGREDDLIALSTRPLTNRQYGDDNDGFTTDAEAACIRRVDGRVTRISIVGGTMLKYRGKDMITCGSDVTGVSAQIDVNGIAISAQGRGKVTVDSGGGPKVIEMIVGTSTDDLTLTPPAFSTAPKAIGRAVGIPVVIPDPKKDDLADPATYIAALPYPDMVVVTWKTSAPANATIEYAPADRAASPDAWVRATNPEPMGEHRFLLSQLKEGQSYQLRISCQSDDGRIGKIDATYTHHP